MHIYIIFLKDTCAFLCNNNAWDFVLIRFAKKLKHFAIEKMYIVADPGFPRQVTINPRRSISLLFWAIWSSPS